VAKVILQIREFLVEMTNLRIFLIHLLAVFVDFVFW